MSRLKLLAGLMSCTAAFFRLACVCAVAPLCDGGGVVVVAVVDVFAHRRATQHRTRRLAFTSRELQFWARLGSGARASKMINIYIIREPRAAVVEPRLSVCESLMT